MWVNVGLDDTFICQSDWYSDDGTVVIYCKYICGIPTCMMIYNIDVDVHDCIRHSIYIIQYRHDMVWLWKAYEPGCHSIDMIGKKYQAYDRHTTCVYPGIRVVFMIDLLT